MAEFGEGQTSLDVALPRLRREASSAQAAWLDAISGTSPQAAEVHLQVASDRATPAALTLYTLDRELRRSVAVIRADYELPRERAATVGQAFRPIPLSSGGLTIERVRTESPPDFFLVGFGLLAQLLLSDPIQILITTKELLGWSGRIVVRVKRALGHENVIYSSAGGLGLKTTESGFQIGQVPAGTRIRVKHRSSNGTVTEVEIERS